MEEIGQLIIASIISALISASVVSTIVNFLLRRQTATIEAEIKNQSEKNLEIFQSKRTWKENSISELLGPLYLQFDRTNRAMHRWKSQNLYLEAKVIKVGNLAIRDLLLTKSHLIPPELLEDAGKLVEHYDRWLEEFENIRGSEKPDLETPFVFVGHKEFPFPKVAEVKFLKAFHDTWKELYEPDNQ